MRRSASIILVGTALTLCGCTSSFPTAERTTPLTTVSTTPSQTAAPALATSSSYPVVAYQPTHETVLGFLDQQEGINAIGPLSTDAPAIAVHVECRGAGTLDVQVSGIGSSSAPCQPTSGVEGVKSVFDVRLAEEELFVEVKGESGQQWAITVTETTQETPN